jgi:hypothetical protein
MVQECEYHPAARQCASLPIARSHFGCRKTGARLQEGTSAALLVPRFQQAGCSAAEGPSPGCKEGERLPEWVLSGFAESLRLPKGLQSKRYRWGKLRFSLRIEIHINARLVELADMWPEPR